LLGIFQPIRVPTPRLRLGVASILRRRFPGADRTFRDAVSTSELPRFLTVEASNATWEPARGRTFCPSHRRLPTSCAFRLGKPHPTPPSLTPSVALRRSETGSIPRTLTVTCREAPSPALPESLGTPRRLERDDLRTQDAFGRITPRLFTEERSARSLDVRTHSSHPFARRGKRGPAGARPSCVALPRLHFGKPRGPPRATEEDAFHQPLQSTHETSTRGSVGLPSPRRTA
jgi:hypothetical protein